MTASDGYARQKLLEALNCLVDEGPLRRRLTHTIPPLSQLIHSGSVTDDLLATIEDIMEELKGSTPTAIGDYYRPRSHLSPRRAREIAREILKLYTDVHGGI